jgi:aspartyl protease family protein
VALAIHSHTAREIRSPAEQAMRGILTFAAMAIAIGLVVPKLYQVDAPAKALTANVETPAPVNNSRSVTLTSGRNGHFQTEASIDGRRIEFLVDTGASVIALRESDAARLGIHPSARDYSSKVSTANGVVSAARTELNRVEVGDITVRNVVAIILPDEALGQNLLGMSFLSRLRWEQRNGKLILEQ